MAIAVVDFLRLALMEIRVARAGDVVSPDDAADALLIFNELLDALNGDGRALYSTTMTTFTLTPNLQPHTIGVSTNVPAPTFNVTIARPQRFRWANLVLANNIRVPIDLITSAEFSRIRAGAATGQTPTIKTSIPTVLMYSPDWPNGAINLWPVPNTANGLEVEFETLLAQLLLTDIFDLPMGYQQALRLTLAELLAPAFGQTVAASTATKAREARARVWDDNDEVPNLRTVDGGMPGGLRGGGYDYRTGSIS